MIGAGALAMQGDLVPVVDWVRDSFLVYPARAFVAFPLVYHYGGGMRHLLWDFSKFKMQGEKGDVLDLDVCAFASPCHCVDVLDIRIQEMSI